MSIDLLQLDRYVDVLILKWQKQRRKKKIIISRSRLIIWCENLHWKLPKDLTTKKINHQFAYKIDVTNPRLFLNYD